ncbi:TIM barrel protein [Oscillochloris sp. ZM17-4]|uniref:hydroxypyruvate isomerase family protein n=1 Tax=Oscillochloris sp. ZM17-4 TaxID=2866714 RepID=UPI001C7341AC|nr:TIM barrel protein [Oscillochloris sp. ZM17-4]MBX0326463.1 TIM barrel protein [Oscillochloris sp. ZM17-4]
MITFDLNISITMPGLPYARRIDEAARMGFTAVELWWPRGEDLGALARRVSDAGLSVALINFDGGDLAAGERGFLNDPVRQAEFRASAPAALDLARRLGCHQLNALVGRWLPGEPRESQLARVRENLTWVCDLAAHAGVTVLLEALNSWETPAYMLTSTADSLAMIDSVGAPNLALQYDVYHMQRMEGNICATVAAHAGRIGHIQFADSPGRGQPGTGELNFPFIFQAIEDSGYTGYVGAEYLPRGSLEESLGWLRRAGEAPDQA